MRRTLKTLFALTLLFSSMAAYADMPVIDFATIAQLSKELSELERQSHFLEQQLTALKQLDANQYQWSNAQSLINELGNVMSRTNGLSYRASNLDSRFKQMYPGFEAPENYSAQYKNNTNSALNTMNGVLQGLGLSSRDFENENRRLEFLQRQSQSAKGQTQAIQAASQIASEQVTQTQLLRQTLMAQTNAQTIYYSTQMQNEASQQAELQKIIQAGSTKVPEYGTSGYSLETPDF